MPLMPANWIRKANQLQKLWQATNPRPGLPTSIHLWLLSAQVSTQGHFHLGARWLSMEDPIDRELVVNAIHKYQNTWPDSLEARATAVGCCFCCCPARITARPRVVCRCPCAKRNFCCWLLMRTKRKRCNGINGINAIQFLHLTPFNENHENHSV